MQKNKKIRFLNRNFTFVFKRKHFKEQPITCNKYFDPWNKLRLSIYYEKSKVVGRVNLKNNEVIPCKQWKHSIINSHMIGIDLLFIKMWVTIDKGAMDLEIKIK